MMTILPILLGSALWLPVSYPAPQEVASEVVAAQSPQEISREERLNRTYAYSTGSRYILQLVLDGVLEAEVERRKQEGSWSDACYISDEELEEDIQRRMEEVLAIDPTADFWAQVRAQGFTKETFRGELRRTLQAQRMFFPLDPEDWPLELIKEVLGPQWDNYLKKDYESLLEMRANGEFQPLNEQMMNNFLMPNIWQFLRKKEEVLKPSDGLAEGICLVVNGKEHRTEDVIAAIEPLLSDTDRAWAETFVSNMELLEKDLKASGAYLDQETFDTMYRDEAAIYEGTIISHEMMVLQFLGFPSMELYRQFFRVRFSYRNLLPEEESQEYLAMVDQMIEARNSFYGAGKVQAEVLLVSAREKATGKFRMEGDPFADAAERAEEVKQILQDGEPFDQVLLEYSDYPAAVTGSANGMPQPNRGRFDALSRNDLRGFLMENDYTDFLFGYSVADDIFFRAQEGAVYGPIRSPLGYCFYRVVKRTTVRKETNFLDDKNTNWLVSDDLLSQRFLGHLSKLRKGS